jgi:hypothetical protein
MNDEHLNRVTGIAPGWQQRREGLQVYFCCCPFALLLAPFLIVARLARFGTQRLLGRPAVSPWARDQRIAARSER